jgi:DNA topoisomerase IB
MEWHTVSKLSANQEETAEGYLICRNVPIARTGTQIYWENEVPPLQGDQGGRVHVDREASEVFSPDSVRSFIGKPLVDDHPYDAVGPDNYSDLAIGYVSNPRRGEGAYDDLLLADLIFTTRRGIDAVKRGKRAISVGYNAHYEQTAPGLGRQRNIFCNHVALVDEGRCGSRCTILDSGTPEYSYDAFVESEHPRVKSGPGGGEFTSGGGGGGGAAAHHETTKVANGKRVTSSGADLPEHIQKLKLPPAWTDVTYSPDPAAKLQATGRDVKGRRQLVYSAEFSAKQAAAKFARAKKLAEAFKDVRKQNEAARRELATREAADATALIMATGIRPGSTGDTGAETQAYGATTLQGRHVVSLKDGVRLRFTGKKGVSLDLPIQDPGIAKMLLKRKEAAGARGDLFGVNAGGLLKHVHSLGDGSFKTKDFRTHLGTQTALDEVERTPEPTNEREYKRAVKHVATIVSQKLGNTPTIALQSYISPVVFAQWQQSAGIGGTADAAWADDDGDRELPDAHWGEVGSPLPDPDEDDEDPDDELLEVTPADVIAMLGFDPLEFLEDEDEGEADDGADIDYDNGEDIDYADADFVEGEHPRVPKGSPGGGEFTSGGGGGGGGSGGSKVAAAAQTVPHPPAYWSTPAGKKLHALTKELLTKGTDPHEAAAQIQQLASNYKHGSIAKYANTMIAHVGAAHGVTPSAKAAPKPTASVPPKPAATPTPQPAASTPPPQSAASLHAQIFKIAVDPSNISAAKIAKITALANTSLDPSVKTLANQWIQKLSGTPVGTVSPATSASPSSSTTPSPNAVRTPNQKRLEIAQAKRKQAHDVPSAAAPQARAICPSLDRSWWTKPDVSKAGKAACVSYKGGSGGINGALRSDATAPAYAQEMVDDIDLLFEHPDAVLHADAILRRGEDVPDAMLQQWKDGLAAGKIVRPQRLGFTSTSMAKEAAFSSKSVIYEIVARKGTPALGIWAADKSYVSENEVLLRHGIAFDVYEIEKVGKQHIVRCTTV